MKVKIVDFKIEEKKDDKGNVTTKTNAESMLDVLTFAVNDKFSEKKHTQQGEQNISTLSGSQGRMWGRIQRKFDDAIDKKGTSVDLETAEIDFLKTAIQGAKFPVNWFRWTVLIEDALEEKEK